MVSRKMAMPSPKYAESSFTSFSGLPVAKLIFRSLECPLIPVLSYNDPLYINKPSVNEEVSCRYDFCTTQFIVSGSGGRVEVLSLLPEPLLQLKVRGIRAAKIIFFIFT